MIKLSNISEGIWGNISKRADGTLDRKEENLNTLGLEEFYEYIKRAYKIEDPINDVFFRKKTPRIFQEDNIIVCLTSDKTNHNYIRYNGRHIYMCYDSVSLQSVSYSFINSSCKCTLMYANRYTSFARRSI